MVRFLFGHLHSLVVAPPLSPCLLLFYNTTVPLLLLFDKRVLLDRLDQNIRVCSLPLIHLYLLIQLEVVASSIRASPSTSKGAWALRVDWLISLLPWVRSRAAALLRMYCLIDTMTMPTKTTQKHPKYTQRASNLLAARLASMRPMKILVITPSVQRQEWVEEVTYLSHHTCKMQKADNSPTYKESGSRRWVWLNLLTVFPIDPRSVSALLDGEMLVKRCPRRHIGPNQYGHFSLLRPVHHCDSGYCWRLSTKQLSLHSWVPRWHLLPSEMIQDLSSLHNPAWWSTVLQIGKRVKTLYTKSE